MPLPAYLQGILNRILTVLRYGKCFKNTKIGSSLEIKACDRMHINYSLNDSILLSNVLAFPSHPGMFA
jgi:hypothetical protein